MKGPDFAAAQAYALDRLAHELAAWFSYHSLSHTSETVIPAASGLAVMEGLSTYQQALVATGCAFHDLGFVAQYFGHEAAGARIGREILPGFGFDQVEVETIEGMIMATRLPQSPRTLLECIVADADLATLGQDHFLERNASLRRELTAVGRSFTDTEWFSTQLKFMQGHHYWTTSARSWFDAQKAENTAALAALLAESAVPK